MKKIIITTRQAELLNKLKTVKKLKITQEQYNRIINPLLIEGDLNRVDKSFKQAFTGANRSNLKEGEIGQEHHNAVIKLIHHCYQSPEFAGVDPYWESKGLDWDDISSFLKGLGLLIQSPDGYELAKKFKNKTFNSSAEAIETVEDVLQVLIKKKAKTMEPVEAVDPIMELEPMEEDSNYPAGSDTPMAPWNMKDGGKPSNAPKLYKTIAMNYEIAILKDAAGHLHCMLYDELPTETFGDLAEVDAQAITDYVNDNAGTITQGEGIAAYESGVELVKLDDELRLDLLSIYDKNPSLASALATLTETTVCGSSATGGSSGPFSGPLNMPVIKKDKSIAGKVPVVMEGPVAGMTADGGSSGPYDANALPGIGRDGSFKKPKKSRAETSTQYPHGTFVDIDDCTKLNNNKDAQNGKCSNGAVDQVAKQRKGKGSIISKDALLNELAMVQELGINDWQVKAINDKLKTGTPEEQAKICLYVTGRPIHKLSNPEEDIIAGLSEMGKSDMDILFAQIFNV